MTVPYPTGIMALSLQRAIWQKLTADTELASLVTGIFDAVPDGQPFPYVTIGVVTEVPENTLDHVGRSLSATYHVWTQENSQTPAHGGFTQGLTIANRIVQLLDQQELPLDSGYAWRCQLEAMHTLIDMDGVTRHVPVIFRVGAQF